ncbi:MAG: trypsin-like peptidase domain-containing protein [Acutalibacteraceae bacterium]|nr:trypsin-like peptidase domain-containing protein [Acutalibacteraceae bacterium]
MMNDSYENNMKSDEEQVTHINEEPIFENTVSDSDVINSEFIEEAINEANSYEEAKPIIENATPVFKPQAFEYSPVVKKKEPISKGLKVFALIMAAVIIATGSCIGGYLLGVNRISGNNYSSTTLDLTAKPADTDEYTAAQVYDMVNKSVVGITVYGASGNASTASGVVYTEDGYIITNDHIYEGIAGAKFRVRFSDGKEYPAVFVAGDTRSDLAVIKIDGNGFTPAVFGNSEELVIGENVVAVGRPNQIEENSITEGIVSLKDRRVSTSSNYTMKMIQTSTPINPGNSGGALVNMYGQIIGITSSKIAGDAYEGIGFAIPTTTTKWVVESLIEYGCVNDRARLGITYQTINEITKEIGGYKTTGILVASVAEDSGLYGKVNEGDIITEVNGVAITSDSVILDAIEASKPSDVLEFTVYTESGATKRISAKLLPDTGSSSYVYTTK